MQPRFPVPGQAENKKKGRKKLEHRTHYFASFSYGEEPRLFGGAEEIAQEFENMERSEEELHGRLAQVRSAVKALNTLTLSGGDADARMRILSELSHKRKETEALLEELKERKAHLKEEWDDACFYLRSEGSHT